MKIYDITKTYEIPNPDLERGYLKEDKKLITHHPYKPKIVEVGHYETVKTYANGGKDVRWVVDIAGQEECEAYDEYEEINIYVPYTNKEILNKKIAILKQKLLETDYQAIKFAEGMLSESEYAPVKAQRQEWRVEINLLEYEYNLM